MRPCSWVLCCSGGPARCCQCRAGRETSMLPLPWLTGQLSIPSLPCLAFPQNEAYLSKSTSAEKLLYALLCIFPASILTFSTRRFASRKFISAESSLNCTEANGHQPGDGAPAKDHCVQSWASTKWIWLCQVLLVWKGFF